MPREPRHVRKFSNRIDGLDVAVKDLLKRVEALELKDKLPEPLKPVQPEGAVPPPPPTELK